MLRIVTLKSKENETTLIVKRKRDWALANKREKSATEENRVGCAMGNPWVMSKVMRMGALWSPAVPPVRWGRESVTFRERERIHSRGQEFRIHAWLSPIGREWVEVTKSGLVLCDLHPAVPPVRWGRDMQVRKNEQTWERVKRDNE